MANTLKSMLDDANSVVPRIDVAQAKRFMEERDVLVVDVRDASEVQESGILKGAINVSRGMIEFRADPDSPAHNPAFAKEKTTILYCGTGGRAALSGKTLLELGYGEVYNIGGFKDLVESGMDTE